MQVKGWWCLESINEFEIQTLTKSAFDFKLKLAHDFFFFFLFRFKAEMEMSQFINLGTSCKIFIFFLQKSYIFLSLMDSRVHIFIG